MYGKMKIKEVQAGVKITKNYNSYQASLSAEIETGEDTEKIGAGLMEKALVIVSRQIELNKKIDSSEIPEIEVGAAWEHKKFQNKLSVKYSKNEKWEDVNLEDLEKIKKGYLLKTEQGNFIFKRIPEYKRENSKMPIFRIYKIENQGGRKVYK